MITNILSGLFILAFVISAITGIFKARKFYWLEALVRTVFTVLSAVLSLFLASILSAVAAP